MLSGVAVTLILMVGVRFIGAFGSTGEAGNVKLHTVMDRYYHSYKYYASCIKH